MTPHGAREYRQQLIEDGFCRIPGVAPAALIEEVRRVADRVMERAEADTVRGQRVQHTSVELARLARSAGG